MIQNIRPHIYHNEYRPAPPEEEDLVFAFSETDRKILLSQDEKRVPRVRDLKTEDRECLRFLFFLDGRNCFLFREPGKDLQIPGFFYDGIKTLRRDGSDVLGFAGSTAWHLATWYRRNTFCGACGAKLVPGSRERCMICPSCGNVVYPMIAPAVIIGITDGDKIVMTRYRGREYRGRALVAGFCEIGEERIRRAGAKIVAEIEEANRQLKLGEEPKPVPDVGFRVLRIDSSNFTDTYATPDGYAQDQLHLFEDNVKPDRSDLDLLFQVLPTLRIPYSATIEEIEVCGKRTFDVNHGQLVACFDVEVGADCIEQIAKMQPIYAVFRDASMADDATEANFEELFKTFSPDTVRKVI